MARMSPVGDLGLRLAAFSSLTLAILSHSETCSASPQASQKSESLPSHAPLWQASLSEPLLLPLERPRPDEWIVSTTNNRIGLFRDREALWWIVVETSVLAVPAFVVASSDVGILLRNGVFEVRHFADGTPKLQVRLPLTDCASSAAYSQHNDGTLSVACSNAVIRLDPTGRVLSSAALDGGCSPIQLMRDLVACSSGTWFWHKRWRGPSPLPIVGTPRSFSASTATPLWILLQDARVLRFDVNGEWSFESTWASATAVGIEAIAANGDGGWLSLDSRGIVTWHHQNVTRVMGAIGPMAVTPKGPSSSKPAPLLASLRDSAVVAAWPGGPLYLLRGTTSKRLDDSSCSASARQVLELGSSRLLAACGDGRLALFSAK